MQTSNPSIGQSGAGVKNQLAQPVQIRRRKIKVRKYRDHNRPNLHFVVNHREAGKRKRSFFETKEQANSFVAFKNAELKRNGFEHAEFSTALRVMAQDA